MGTPAEQDPKLYRLLVENSLGLMCIHDMDGVLLSINPAAAQSLGYRVEECCGRSIRELLAPSVQHLFGDYLRRIRENSIDAGIMRLQAKDGTERLWLYRNVRYEEAGSPTRVLGHAQDIPGRRIIMPIAKELTIRIEDKPGTLAQCCRALAERDVNILAFQAFEREGQSLIRMVVDDPATAKKLLDADRIYYTETEVAQVALPHRSGELYRAASRLGEAHVNVNYAYCGTQPGPNMSLVVFGVTDAAKAISLLEEVAEAA